MTNSGVAKGAMKVSSKNQVCLPAEVRKAMDIKPGDRLLVTVVGNHMTVMKEPKNWSAYMLGLHKEVWEGVDAQEYVDELRGPWPE